MNASVNAISQRPIVHHKKRILAYLACAFFLILADVLFVFKIAGAAPSYTPYANSVAGQSGTSVGTADNAVGAPDGQTAGLIGVNSSITLDMGAGEEGTNSLKVYFGSVNLNDDINVAFLDSSQNVISQQSRSLFFNTSASTSTFGYDWHDSGKAYRFVRLTSTAGGGFNLDAVEALGFIGSTPTQDTDGDGIPDRQDAQPLVFNQPPANTTPNPILPQTTPSNTSTSNTTSNSRTTNNSTTTPGTTQVNNPVPASQDTDGDGMPDSWEISHGLNPNVNDANQDPDHDKLTNLQEYQAGTDPHKMDTDGDGMPDGWEVQNGLNPLVNDADNDPDGDFLTNLGEYHFGTNPFRADKVTVNADGSCTLVQRARLNGWDWLIFGLLLAGAVLSFLAAAILAAAPNPDNKSSKGYRFRHRLYRAFRPRSKVD